MEQIEINGLLWDTENLEVDGKKLFTWQEAKKMAAKNKKRLPTFEELRALYSLGNMELDIKKDGIWLADKKLFFPFDDLFSPKDSFSTIQHGAYIISGTKEYENSFCSLFIDNERCEEVCAYDDCVYMSIRLVKDISWFRKMINYIRKIFH